jgi:hypothetical protein
VSLLRRLGRAFRVDDELADPGLVAQVDEDQPAVVAAAGDPAGEGVTLADVPGPDFSCAEVAPPHTDSLSASSSSGTSTSCAPPARIVAACGADDDGGSRAQATGLRQLALERAPCVVGICGPAGGTQSGHQLEDEIARAVVADEEDVDRLFGRRLDTGLLERQQQPFDACAEADARRVGTADLLDQSVVATPGADRALRAVLGTDELEDGSGVVVEAADECRHELVFDPVGIEERPDRVEVLAAGGAEGLADLRGIVQRGAHALVLHIEDPERRRRTFLPRVVVEDVVVRVEPRGQALDVGGAAFRIARSS